MQKTKELKRINEINFKSKDVLLRLDLNVPLIFDKDKIKIRDTSRIDAGLRTLKYIKRKSPNKILIISHLSRPNGFDRKYSLKPIYDYLKTKINIKFIDENILNHDFKLNKFKLKKGIFLLENIRFYKQETEGNCKKLINSILNLINNDIYINDAFSVSHRNHCSIAKIPKYFKEKTIGLTFQEEINHLNRLFNDKKPKIALLGGSKLKDKIPIIKNLAKEFDYLLIGGALSFSFFKALNYDLSKNNFDGVEAAKKILEKYNDKIILPVDFKIANSFNSKTFKEYKIKNKKIRSFALDISDESIKLFKKYLKQAKTIIVNGPMGYFENPVFSKSSIKLIKYLSKLNSYRVIGGGETRSIVDKLKLNDKFDYVSYSGGAFLEYIAGKRLPGIKVLTE